MIVHVVVNSANETRLFLKALRTLLERVTTLFRIRTMRRKAKTQSMNARTNDLAKMTRSCRQCIQETGCCQLKKMQIRYRTSWFVTRRLYSVTNRISAFGVRYPALVKRDYDSTSWRAAMAISTPSTNTNPYSAASCFAVPEVTEGCSHITFAPSGTTWLATIPMCSSSGR